MGSIGRNGKFERLSEDRPASTQKTVGSLESMDMKFPRTSRHPQIDRHPVGGLISKSGSVCA
ncbi:MAG: hypothetical protein KC931_24365, partial [Candidatus Omnitrophica bacterium]|nr:hypothetical protein [Candidatus Omnitrophota bacterium]